MTGWTVVASSLFPFGFSVVAVLPRLLGLMFSVELASGSFFSFVSVPLGAACLESERLSLLYGLQPLLRKGSLNFIAVSSGVSSVAFPFIFILLGLALLGGGGLSGPGGDPSLPDPEAGVLSGGHLAKGGMSPACVEAGLLSSEGSGLSS